MGYIQTIYDPEKWEILKKGKSKVDRSDYLYKMVIGFCNDEDSAGCLVEIISKDNYDKIVKGIYRVESSTDSDQKIIILDKNDNIIPLVKGNKENVKQLKK